MRRRHGTRRSALHTPALVVYGSTQWGDGCVFRCKVSCINIASYGSRRRLCGDELRSVNVAEGSMLDSRPRELKAKQLPVTPVSDCLQNRSG